MHARTQKDNERHLSQTAKHTFRRTYKQRHTETQVDGERELKFKEKNERQI